MSFYAFQIPLFPVTSYTSLICFSETPFEHYRAVSNLTLPQQVFNVNLPVSEGMMLMAIKKLRNLTLDGKHTIQSIDDVS